MAPRHSRACVRSSQSSRRPLIGSRQAPKDARSQVAPTAESMRMDRSHRSTFAGTGAVRSCGIRSMPLARRTLSSGRWSGRSQIFTLALTREAASTAIGSSFAASRLFWTPVTSGGAVARSTTGSCSERRHCSSARTRLGRSPVTAGARLARPMSSYASSSGVSGEGRTAGKHPSNARTTSSESSRMGSCLTWSGTS